jgi:hypothetical protein
MPDQSGPSPRRPRRQRPLTPAPDELRRRVLARVRAEPEPLGASASRAARRLCSGRGRLLASIAAATAIVIAAVLVLGSGGAGPTVRSASISRELGAATASLDRVGGHPELLLTDMPMAPVGEVYEVWLSGTRSAPRPTNALFNVTSAGTAAVEVPGSLRGVARITVTAEPVGGSTHPSSPVVLSVALPGTG